MVFGMDQKDNRIVVRWSVILILVIIISVLHYITPTMKWQYHLVYMQSYFIPILIAAFQFGIRGGLGVAIAVSILYLPHIMLHWGGLVENNLLRFMQVVIYNIIGFLTGLKAQREKEETLKYKNTAAQLEGSVNTIKQQSDKLVELEEQLRQTDRLAVIGELTSSLAHEVRNPLGSIRGAVEIIIAENTSKNKKTEFSKILVDETERMTTVLENYLSFGKKKKQQESEYVLQEIIQNVILMLSTQARKRGIEILSSVPNNPILLQGDSNDLWQILMNITLNAHQAIIDEGKITIKLSETDNRKSETGNEHTALTEYDRIIKLTISDTGPGISNDDLEKIFKPFYTTKVNGSGLGLAIVKRIADSNNWVIDVNSTKNSGTKFVMIIPIKVA
jgi:signal transduction histidine kinase